MNRAKANKLTRRVQVLALVFAGGAVAAGVIPMTAPSSAVAVEPIVIAPLKPVELPVEVNAPALATAIDLIAPPVVIKDKPPEAAPPPPPSAWKYLGAIISGSYRRAVVTINDRQQLVKVGTKVDATEVMEIDPSFIKIKDGAGAEQMIELEARQQTHLAIAAPTAGARPTPGAVNPYSVGEKGGRRGGMSPELAGQVNKAMQELNGIKGLSPEDRKEKLRGMFQNDKIDVDSIVGDGKGDGKGGK